MPSYSVRKLLACCWLTGNGTISIVSHEPHQEDDQRLRLAIQEIREGKAFYGYRRVTKALARIGRIGQS
jgi:hypothetical protein